MTLYSTLSFWLRQQITIRRLEQVDARLLADIGVPADDIAGYVKARCPDPVRAEMAAARPVAQGMPPLTLRLHSAC